MIFKSLYRGLTMYPTVCTHANNARSSYLTPCTEVDEDELDAELEALGEEIDLGGGWEAEAGGVPSFLDEPSNAVPDFLDEQPGKVKEAV